MHYENSTNLLHLLQKCRSLTTFHAFLCCNSLSPHNWYCQLNWQQVLFSKLWLFFPPTLKRLGISFPFCDRGVKAPSQSVTAFTCSNVSVAYTDPPALNMLQLCELQKMPLILWYQRGRTLYTFALCQKFTILSTKVWMYSALECTQTLPVALFVKNPVWHGQK